MEFEDDYTRYRAGWTAIVRQQSLARMLRSPVVGAFLLSLLPEL